MNQSVANPHWPVPGRGEPIAGKYVVEGVLSHGASVVVLSASRAPSGERVAIKILLPERVGAAQAEATDRFLRDARAAARVESDHAARVLEVATLESGAPYVVLELPEGPNLEEVLAKWQPLPIASAVDWIAQACEAVGEGHLYGVVHRDLRPSNLVVMRRSGAGETCMKVIDFGPSKPSGVPAADMPPRLTGTTSLAGSPFYLATEQLRASCELDARTDVWAFGAILYELLSGEPPFLGNTLPQVCAAVLTETPRPLTSLRSDVPPSLAEAIGRCLEKDPRARFAGAVDLARALAPFGTKLTHASLAYLERLSAAGGRASLPPGSNRSWLPASSSASAQRDSSPDAVVFAPPRAAGASARIVLGSLFALTGLGGAVFLAMYGSVHRADSLRASGPLGVTAVQGMVAGSEVTASPSVPPPPPLPLALPAPLAPLAASVPAAPPAGSPPAQPSPAARADMPAAVVTGRGSLAGGGSARLQRAPAASRPTVPRTVVHVAPGPVSAARPTAGVSAPTVSDASSVGSPTAATAAADPESAKAEANPYEQPQPPTGSPAPPTGAQPATGAPTPGSDPYESVK